jgi:serine protease Do
MNTKNLLSLVLAGLIGGAAAIGGAQLLTNTFKSQNNNKNRYAQFTNVPPTPGGVVDLSQAAAAASPSVVFIESAESNAKAQSRSEQDPYSMFFNMVPQQKKGTGSGVILTEDGYVVTNDHVIDFADDIQVTLSDNRKFKAKLVGKDPQTDLAVLKIEANSLTAIRKGDADQAKIGEWVLAIGNPYQIGTTVTAGIISAKGKSLGIYQRRENGGIESFIQTDAVVNPGNSGGALVDAQGRLIGINSAIQTHTGSYEGYSFAIPVNLMTRVVDDLIQNGTVTRSYLGVEYVAEQNFDTEVKNRGLNVSEGVLVDNVRNGGSAQYAGILPNDVITAINGEKIKSGNQLRAKVNTAKVGETLSVTLVRKGREMQLPVTLKALPKEPKQSR